jgi:hypothetical protein
VVLGGLSAAFFGVVATCADRSRVENEDFRRAAQEVVGQANLTLAEFPNDWTSRPQEDSVDEPQTVPDVLSGDCRLPFERLSTTEDVAESEYIAAVAESDEFEADDTHEIVTTRVDIFFNERDVTGALDEFARIFSQCKDQLAAAFEEEFERSLSEQTGPIDDNVDFEVFDVAKRPLGEEAYEWGYTSSYSALGMPFELTLRLTLIRSGHVLAAFMHLHQGTSNEAVVTSLREKFSERLEQADDSLPD